MLTELFKILNHWRATAPDDCRTGSPVFVVGVVFRMGMDLVINNILYLEREKGAFDASFPRPHVDPLAIFHSLDTVK